MAETLVIEPSLADLRAMIADPAGAPSGDAGNEQTSEKPAEQAKPAAEAEKPEAESEPAEKQPEAEAVEEPLPENVKKRIAKETEKATRIQAEIDRAVSARKAKEAELAKLKAEAGAEPDQNTDKQAGGPKKPDFQDGMSWEQYQKALEKWESDRETWLLSEAEKRAEEKITARQREQEAASKRTAAVADLVKAGTVKDAAEFDSLLGKAAEAAPEGLQMAVSSLDNWAGVAVHLAKNPAKLDGLIAEFNANPYKAIATLGRIEAALSATPKEKTATKEAPLPKPPNLAGGSGSAADSEFDWENASIKTVWDRARKIRGR